MDELQHAIDQALAALPHDPHVRRAAQLARFQAREDGGPFWDGDLSRGVPQPPRQPLLPALQGEAPELEALMYQLVWAADCAEYSDANHNARTYRQAAGHVELAARAQLGPEGLTRWPAVYVRDLAAAAHLDLEAFVPAMGMFPPHPGASAQFEWDIHHEHPVADPVDLGRRKLTRYRVGGVSWSQPELQARPLGAFASVAELVALAPVNAIALAAALGAPDAFARTVDVHMSSWVLTTPDGPLRFQGQTVIARLAGSPSGPRLDLNLPAAAAAALGEDDVVRCLDVG